MDPVTLGAGLGFGASKLLGNHSDNPDYTGQDTGYPNLPGFDSILTADGALRDGYKLKGAGPIGFQSFMPQEESNLNGIQLNKDPLKALETYAGGHGDSPWAQAALQALDQSSGQAMGAAKDSATSAGTSAADLIAARGGLSSGAAENLARNTANNATNAGQNVIGNKLTQQGQIRSADEQNRLATLQQLPGQEVNALQPDIAKQGLWQQAASFLQGQNQNLDLANRDYDTNVNKYNLDSIKQGLNATNNYNMSKYQSDIQKQAGEEMARATQNQGKK